jgi:D-alanyl-D-alanine carboxypeptidase/D-alanyl-D-alanine-endopeptidase (penicillin-binding protein 4)
MYGKIFSILFISFLMETVAAQIPQQVKRLLNSREMKGASLSLTVKEVKSGKVVYAYEKERELTPASVMKLVTTAAALEILGSDFRFSTSLEYDGEIADSTLTGNLYIKGGGDPTLGSAHLSPDRNAYTPDRNTFVPEWLAAVKKAGIKTVTGRIIADDSIFDTEGVSGKWQGEDWGSYYGAGCYGLSVFDNQYTLYLKTGEQGSKPSITTSEPLQPSIRFHNYLTAVAADTDSAYIAGYPFSCDRYLYGAVPANRQRLLLRGDIPDPPLFLAQYVDEQFRREGITIGHAPACFRQLSEAGYWPDGERKRLVTTCSPPLSRIARLVNERSINLFADALLKTLGLRYLQGDGEVISSFGKGIHVVREHWRNKGLDVSSLWMFDGSGLSVSDKLTASFLCDLLVYMATSSGQSEAFTASLPQAGLEGSVVNFLKGSAWQGKALLKSGGMSRVRSFAGYITHNSKQYAVAVIVNQYACDNKRMTKELEKLLLSLF